MVRGRPQPTPARQRNDPQTIPWKRAWRERERFRAPRVSTVSFSDPPEPWSGGRPQPTAARGRNGTQTIAWKRAWHERERSRAPGVSKVYFPDPPHQAAPSCLHRIACKGSPANDPHQATKRHPNDTLETRITRVGAHQGAHGIKSVVFGHPSPRRASTGLWPGDRTQTTPARQRTPPITNAEFNPTFAVSARSKYYNILKKCNEKQLERQIPTTD